MIGSRGVLAVAALAAVSCQTYDFEPVRPLAIAQTVQTKNVTAHPLKPDMMILLDKSGSMQAPLQGGGTCGTCNYPACPEATCPTRMGQMTSAMNGFLMSSGNVARMGLTAFPNLTAPGNLCGGSNQCGAATAMSVLTAIHPASDSDADLQTWATGINGQIQMANTSGSPTFPGGGTPTGGSLTFLGTVTELNDPNRDDFILLLTDGEPNCNPMNAVSCLNPACVPTVSPAATTQATNDCNYCTRGCLDEDATVQAIKNLRDQNAHAGGIRTIVVGFGSDFTTGAALDTLNAMAIAGGFQATCPMGTDAECGANNTCNTATGVCTKAFFSASNEAQLTTALAQISSALGGDSVCTYILEAQPSSADLLSVLIDGVATASGPDTWELQAGKLIFQGMLCDKLKATTTQDPVNVEVRIVQSL